MVWNDTNIQVIKDVCSGKLSKERAASILNMATITIARRVNAYTSEGQSCFIHKNKGKKSIFKKDISAILKIIDKEGLRECNFAHIAELLYEHYGIKISDTCLRKGLYELGILSIKTRKKTRKKIKKFLEEKLKEAGISKKTILTKNEKITLTALDLEEYSGKYVHPTKPKSRRFGERIEMDACSGNFLDGAGKLTLHVAIDDASGELVGLYLEEQETLHGYYEISKQMLSNHGIPLSIRTDRRSVFTYNKTGEGKPENDTMTQFAYAMSKLGVDLQCNSDPDFKPKCERANQTLQGQLRFDLRLAKIKTIEDANKYLEEVYIPKFNKKYGYSHDIVNNRSVKIESAFEPCSEKQIKETLVCLFERTVNKGATISFKSNYYALYDDTSKQVILNNKTKLTVVITLNNELYAINEKTNKCYVLDIVPNRQSYSPELEDKPKMPKKKYSPPASHPWSYESQKRFKETDKMLKKFIKPSYTKTA